MASEKPKTGLSGMILVIGMVLGAAILGVIAWQYRNTHPPIIPATQPATTSDAIDRLP